MMAARLNSVSADHVRRARRLLAQGWSLRDVANHMRIGAGALDYALWAWIGERL